MMALVSATFFYVYTTAINPDFIENRTELMRKSLCRQTARHRPGRKL
ncbi:MAG: hypothetical protein R3B47_05950 [Bacteroidia bacterium]